MNSYLSTIHKRSEKHKKRFAFLVSASVTVIIFFIWSLFTFKPAVSTVADNTLEPVQVAGAAAALPDAVTAESPFDAVKSGLQNVLDSIQQGFSQTKSTIESVNMNQKYQSVRNDALPTTTYGN